jgi:hypothetical protein
MPNLPRARPPWRRLPPARTAGGVVGEIAQEEERSLTSRLAHSYSIVSDVTDARASSILKQAAEAISVRDAVYPASLIAAENT